MWCGAHTGLGWLGWTLMSVGMIAFWGLIAWAIVALIRGARPSGTDAMTPPDEVLAGRLARGEISTDEYVRARHLLDDGPAQPDPHKSKEEV
jgi:putative membrane protein